MKSTDKFQLTQVHNTLRGTGLGELVRMAVTYLLHNTLFSITFLFLRKLNPQGKHAVKCGSCNFFLFSPVFDLFDDEAVQIFYCFKEMEQALGAMGEVRCAL